MLTQTMCTVRSARSSTLDRSRRWTYKHETLTYSIASRLATVKELGREARKEGLSNVETLSYSLTKECSVTHCMMSFLWKACRMWRHWPTGVTTECSVTHCMMRFHRKVCRMWRYRLQAWRQCNSLYDELAREGLSRCGDIGYKPAWRQLTHCMMSLLTSFQWLTKWPWCSCVSINITPCCF